MVAGFWYNQDGLPLQYGTQKAVPEVGGDYLVYGEVREIEQYIPLVQMQYGAIGSNPVVSAPPTGAFSGTGTSYASAGILSPTTLFPLAQVSPVTTVASSQYTFTAPQIFVEQVEVDTLIPVAGAGSVTMSVGLVTTSPGTPSSSFVQITSTNLSSTGTQFLNAFSLVSGGTANAAVATAGLKTIFNSTGGSYINTSGVATAQTTGGGWVGQFSPIPSNAITPLPQSAWIGTQLSTTGITAGLLKLRVKYVLFGGTNQ